MLVEVLIAFMCGGLFAFFTISTLFVWYAINLKKKRDRNDKFEKVLKEQMKENGLPSD